VVVHASAAIAGAWTGDPASAGARTKHLTCAAAATAAWPSVLSSALRGQAEMRRRGAAGDGALCLIIARADPSQKPFFFFKRKKHFFRVPCPAVRFVSEAHLARGP
jgi:hypothetical protein